MPNQLKLDRRLYETRGHGQVDFPVASGATRISKYIDSRFSPHWHKDPEFTVITDGEMYYQVNDRVHFLKKGMGIYVNSNALHSGWNQENDCEYIPSNFDPAVIIGGKDSRIFKKYVDPIVNSVELGGIVFDPANGEADRRVIEIFSCLAKKLKSGAPYYELDVTKDLYEAWITITERAFDQLSSQSVTRSGKQMSKIKKAIDYVENNFFEQITLGDLAAVCCMSESALCRSFKAVMRQTPMEYIAVERIYKSLPMLASHEYSITEVAEKCGFSGSSYYAEVFKRYMNCTPSQYANNSIKK